jgi:alanine racemase
VTDYASGFNECRVDLGALARNYKRVSEFSKCRVMAVVKGDAYGHGLVEAGLALVEAGCQDLGVLDLEEALALKRHPIEADITVLAGLHGQIQSIKAVEAGVVVFAYDLGQVMALSKIAERLDKTARILLKVDTGMGRLGIPWEKAPYTFSSLSSLKNLKIEGLCTHLATCGDDGAREQLERFAEVGFKAKKTAKGPLKLSALASGGILAHPGFPDDLSRTGIMLYGNTPLEPASPALSDLKKSKSLIKSLEPAMAITSRLIQVREAKAGETISYDRTFKVPKTLKFGTAPIGYVHGIGRSRSSTGHALIGGRKAKLLGRVCMNLTMYDLSGINAHPGDEVVIMGAQGDESIGAAQIGAWEGTSPYEILCRLGRLNQRRFYRSPDPKAPKKRR